MSYLVTNNQSVNVTAHYVIQESRDMDSSLSSLRAKTDFEGGEQKISLNRNGFEWNKFENTAAS